MNNNQKVLLEMLFLTGALDDKVASNNELINKCYSDLGLNNEAINQLYKMAYNDEITKISTVSNYYRYCLIQ